MKVKVLKPISYHAETYREGDVLAMTEEEFEAYGDEYVAPYDEDDSDEASDDSSDGEASDDSDESDDSDDSDDEEAEGEPYKCVECDGTEHQPGTKVYKKHLEHRGEWSEDDSDEE